MDFHSQASNEMTFTALKFIVLNASGQLPLTLLMFSVSSGVDPLGISGCFGKYLTIPASTPFPSPSFVVLVTPVVRNSLGCSEKIVQAVTLLWTVLSSVDDKSHVIAMSYAFPSP